MSENPFPRRLIKRVENPSLPLLALGAVRDLRAYLDTVEAQALRKARDLGAPVEDMANALGISRQGTYYKLKHLEGPNAETEDEGSDEEADDITVVLETQERASSPE